MKSPTIVGGVNQSLGMRHLNGNVLCALDLGTTGLDYELDEITEVVLIPVDGMLRPHHEKDLRMCQFLVRPNNANSASEAKLSAEKWRTLQAYGTSPEITADRIYAWFERLKLPQGKKLIAVSQNWLFDSFMLRKLLGHKTFELMFAPQFRDPIQIAAFMNDHHEQSPTVITSPHRFPSLKLGSIANRLNITKAQVKSTMSDAMLVLEVYRALLALAAECIPDSVARMSSHIPDDTDNENASDHN